jgi:hypothetical protein
MPRPHSAGCRQSGTEPRRGNGLLSVANNLERSLGGKNGLLPTIWNGASVGKRTATILIRLSIIPCWPALTREDLCIEGGADNLERSLGNIMAGKRNATIFSGVTDYLERSLGNILAGKRNCNHSYQAPHCSALACANIEHINALGC